MLKFIFQSFLKKYYLNEVDQDTYKKHQSNSQSGYSYKKECICPFVLMNSWIDKFQRHHLWNWQQISFEENFCLKRKFKKKKKIFPFPSRGHLFMTSTRKGVIDLLFIFVDAGGGSQNWLFRVDVTNGWPPMSLSLGEVSVWEQSIL